MRYGAFAVWAAAAGLSLAGPGSTSRADEPATNSETAATDDFSLEPKPSDPAVAPLYLQNGDYPETVYAEPGPPREDQGVNAGGVNLDLRVSYLTDYVYRGMNQIITGIVYNIFALGLTTALYTYAEYLSAELQRTLPDVAIPGLSEIPWIGEAVFEQDVMFYGAVVASVVVFYLMLRTWFGLYVRAAGQRPSAVVSTGRRRLRAPSAAASIADRPCTRSFSMRDTSTKPLSTATPSKAMKPTPAEMLSGNPRNASSETPPIKANGTLSRISNDGAARPKLAMSNTKIIAMAAGMTTARRLVALVSRSYSPAHSVK